MGLKLRQAPPDVVITVHQANPTLVLIDALASYRTSWPKWISFSFVYLLALCSIMVTAVTKLDKYCYARSALAIACENQGWLAFLLVIVILGIAGFLTLICVWTARRSALVLRNHWFTTWIAAIPHALVMLGSLACLEVIHRALAGVSIGSETLSVRQITVALGLLVAQIVLAMFVLFLPVCVANGCPLKLALVLLNTSKLTAVTLMLLASILFLAAVAAQMYAHFMLPVLIFLIPFVALCWICAFNQQVSIVEA